MSESRDSLVIPVHGETKKLKRMIEELEESSVLDDKKVILVHDKGSESRKTCRELAEKDTVSVVELENEVGKGKALKEGFRVAEGDCIGFLDADRSFLPEDVKKAIK